ncbi:unnamed protein product [Eruca vesicaria subsp. sativa]|nr:unnamed protein product [Eruca vesicaria subsp. sativa]
MVSVLACIGLAVMCVTGRGAKK